MGNLLFCEQRLQEEVLVWEQAEDALTHDGYGLAVVNTETAQMAPINKIYLNPKTNQLVFKKGAENIALN